MYAITSLFLTLKCQHCPQRILCVKSTTEVCALVGIVHHIHWNLLTFSDTSHMFGHFVQAKKIRVGSIISSSTLSTSPSPCSYRSALLVCSLIQCMGRRQTGRTPCIPLFTSVKLCSKYLLGQG